MILIFKIRKIIQKKQKQWKKKENIASGELEKYFKSTFTDVNYSKKHKEVLEKLLKNNSLEYIKKYLSEQWEYVQNDKKYF